MAGGWTKDGAVQQQVEDSIDDAVNEARTRLPHGESAQFCIECGEPIPQARRKALPGVQYCINCQQEHEKAGANHSLYNRRGNKDSQLK